MLLSVETKPQKLIIFIKKEVKVLSSKSQRKSAAHRRRKLAHERKIAEKQTTPETE